MTGENEFAPRLWIVAGPNGSGKSTAYARSDIAEFDGSVWIINPDLLTQRLVAAEGLSLIDANFASVQRIGTWLKSSIEVHQTIGVETVLSTSKYRRLVRKAKARGFEIRFIYVYVDAVDLQLERIAFRVAKGGHDVPSEKVRLRRQKSFRQFPWFFWEAHWALVFDNSGEELKLVASKQQMGVAELSADLIPELRKGILRPHSYSEASGLSNP